MKFLEKSLAGHLAASKTLRHSDDALKPLAAGLMLLLSGAMAPSLAQTPSAAATPLPAEGVVNNASSAPRNAYADNLRPQVKRPVTLQNQPYNPIRKYDDQGQIPEIEMFVGESRVFPTPGVARIAVGNGQILTAAALDGKETILFANAVGTSSLFVWNEDGRYQRVKVNIVPGDTTRIAREVAAFLTTIPNTKASIVGDKVIIEGEQLSDADISKIEQLEKRYPQIINFTNRLGWEQMVMMDVKVVEFPVDELREIGMKWGATGGAAIGGIWRPIRRGNDGPYQVNIQTGQNNSVPITNPDGSGGVVLPAGLNLLGAVNLGLNAQLTLLAQDGKASILAEPQLAARNGSKASFLAGGEFPYSVTNLNGVTVMFKPYGIKLDIQPKVDRNGVIRATIDSEVSKIDPSVSTIGGPALLTRKTNTEFNVRSGETIVLSGLIQLDNSTSIDKLPLLGDIPVLGALFRSKRFQNKETELVVFVTPTVVDSQSPGLVDRIERTNERLKQNLGRDSLLTSPLQPGHDPARPNVRPPLQTPPHTQGTAPDLRRTSPEAAPLSSYSLPAVAAAPVIDAPAGKLTPAAYEPNVAADRNSPKSTWRSHDGGSTLRVLAEGAVLRAEPGHDSAALLQLARGAVVQLGTAQSVISGSGQWRNIVVGAMHGWVAADAVEPLHRSSTMNLVPGSPIATKDREGRELALGKHGRNVDAADRAARLVNAMMPSSVLPAASDAMSERFRVSLERLALRVTPDVNAPVIQHLARGQMVVALPQTPAGNWRAVQADGVQGWAASQWLIPVNADR